MDASYQERNRAATERIKALAHRSDEELSRPIGDGGWTVAVALAHLAYWDGRTLGVLELFQRHGIGRSWWTPAEADAVNDIRLPTWQALRPRAALEAAIRAAEALDRYVAGLPAGVVAVLSEERPLALDRARHRGSHLDEIEAALSS